MNALLPDVVQRAVERDSLYSASESLGVVALVLLVLLLLEGEALRGARLAPVRVRALTALALPLTLAVVLTVAARIAALIP